ncbi:lipopolysaccharide-induced tumor necrosis factor-alpha factor homolog [Haliotis rufescens]|uniref:lipopolysaccharide-induced tumor necrosis factor-alpha factor homolog n=1 Tax=Haliotis rufescens TaxID=6454 RepID=UPI00201F7256|nr:lipopolysaccharide-induced tumor necrosis factor-alpha factor homolog [Haliotis rufescens]
MASGMAYGDPANPSQLTYGAPLTSTSNPSPAGIPNLANQSLENLNPALLQQLGMVVTTQPPQLLSRLRMGEDPVGMQCIFCHGNIQTSTRYKFGHCTCVSMVMIWMLGGCLGCFLIPLCIDKTKDVIHTCPNCQKEIGRHRK